jgi:tRNA (mo5U34)-methyltransferase
MQRAIGELGPWFQNLHLPDGTQTAPDHYLGDFPTHKWLSIAPFIPEDLRGWRALDVGCNAGFYSFEMAKRGAQVLGIDVDPRYLAQAQWASRQYGLEDRIEFRQMQVYDLAQLTDTFDLVWFTGVFYHLRYPVLGLDIVTQKVQRMMIFQSLTMPGEEVTSGDQPVDLDHREPLLEPGWPAMAFIEHRLAGDPTNWWAPNHAAVEALLRSCGLRVVARPGHEIYVCELDPAGRSERMAWGGAEPLAATAQARERETVPSRSG